MVRVVFLKRLFEPFEFAQSSMPIDNEGESGENKRGQIFPSIQLITNFLHYGFVFKVMTTMRM